MPEMLLVSHFRGVFKQAKMWRYSLSTSSRKKSGLYVDVHDDEIYKSRCAYQWLSGLPDPLHVSSEHARVQ